MVFSSLNFIFIFFPVTLLVMRFIPKGYQNWALLAASLVFYMIGVWDHPIYMLLLLADVAVNYHISLKIKPNPSGKDSSRRKPLFIAGIIYNVFWLFLFKYAAFFRLPVPSLALPAGISFYTFSAISYLADVYMGTTSPAGSMLLFGSYLTMFPKLISGPISTYKETRKTLKNGSRRVGIPEFEEGLRSFCIGLALKVLLANRLSGLWNQLSVIGYESLSCPLAWLGIGCYSLELYFDFYGYSLMALGIGQMIGIYIPENFRHPYMSRSMTEFWRRWHITLGSWFRNYIYIPLGGNRVSSARLCLNLLIVWGLTGLWHGASMNFVLWGLGLFVIIYIEKKGLLKILDRHVILSHIYMILLIPLSWMLFAITDFTQLGMYASRLIPIAANMAQTSDFSRYFASYGSYFIAGIIFCTDYPRKLYEKYRSSILMDALLVALFLYSIYNIYMGMDDPFMYFQF